MISQTYAPHAPPRLGSARIPASEMQSLDAGQASNIVLVVDDDPALLRLLAATLLDEGFGVVTARNGIEALDSIDKGELSAIVLDLEMPVMDGRTFFRELRARGDRTPVLLLSANQPRAARRELGAEAALEKPFEPHALTLHLQRLIDGSF